MGLPWFRLDSNINTHPRILDLMEYGAKGRAAAFTFVCSIAYGVNHSTDGNIRKAALGLIHGTPADAKLLVAVGLWVEVEGGWMIPDWAERQQTKETTEAKRAIRSEAGRKAANARWSKDAG